MAQSELLHASSPAVPRLARGLAFAAAMAVFLAYAHEHRGMAFRGDAFEIWEVAKHLGEPDRPRSFVEYRGPFVFVLYHLVFRTTTALGLPEVSGFHAFSGLLFAVLTTAVAPALMARLLRRPIGPMPAFAFACVVLFFFGGYFLHPQVDFLALVLFLSSVALVLHAMERVGWWPPLVLAALLFAGAVAARFNYIVALPLLIPVLLGGKAERKRKFALVAAFALPVLLLVAVQSLARAEPSGQQRVLRMQLTQGLRVQKIEWNAGDVRYPGGIEVPDRAGQAVLEAVPGRPHWLTERQYVDVVLEHPLTVATIWVRHLFNGLDLWYDEVYVTDLQSGRLARSFLNYTLLFFAWLAVRLHARQWVAGDGRLAWTALAVVAPALSAVPFVIEVRFFIPMLVFAHALALFAIRDVLAHVVSRRLWVEWAVVVGLCLLLSLSVSERAGLSVLPVSGREAAAG